MLTSGIARCVQIFKPLIIERNLTTLAIYTFHPEKCNTALASLQRAVWWAFSHQGFLLSEKLQGCLGTIFHIFLNLEGIVSACTNSPPSDSRNSCNYGVTIQSHDSNQAILSMSHVYQLICFFTPFLAVFSKYNIRISCTYQSSIIIDQLERALFDACIVTVRLAFSW